MKSNVIKCTLFTLSFLSTSLLAHTTHKGQWYAGIGLGGSSLKAKLKDTHRLSAGGFTALNPFSQKLSKGAFIGQFQFGYYKPWEKTFLITEFFVRPKERAAFKSSPWDIGLGLEDYSMRTNLFRKYTLGISAKYGINLPNKAFSMFGNISILRSGFNIQRGHYQGKTPTSDNNPSSIDTAAWGIAPGIGMVYHLKESMPIRLEYAYEIYKSISPHKFTGTYTVPGVGSGTVEGAGHIKPRYHTVMLSLSHKF